MNEPMRETRTPEPMAAHGSTAATAMRGYELTPSQLVIWELGQEAGQPPAPTVGAFELDGILDLPAFEQALAEATMHHDVLRAAVAEDGARPRLTIEETVQLPMPVLELSEVRDADRERELEHVARQQRQRPFDTTRAPLLRFTLLRFDPRLHVLVAAAHRVIADDRSLDLLIREVARSYAAFVRGDEVERGPVVQYVEVAAAPEETRGHDSAAEPPPPRNEPLELPGSRSRRGVGARSPGRLRLEVGADVADALNELAAAEGTTLGLVLLAAYEAVLARTTGEDELAVGVPVDTRSRSDLEDVVGPFEHVVPVSADLSDDPSFASLLRRAADSHGEARLRGGAPLRSLLARAGSDGARPFRTMLAFEENPEPIELSGLRVLRVPLEPPPTGLDLAVFLRRASDGLHGWLEYDAGLLDEGAAKRLADHLATLLAAVAADPARPMSELPILSDEERRLVCEEWAVGPATTVPDACIHELVETQARKTPDAPAVRFGGTELTYRELSRRSNAVAHELRALGIGPERAVGVCMQRSPDLVVTLLGILKAGGAYVPVDPDYPPERVRLLLEDCRAAVLLTTESVVERLPADRPTTVCVDRDWDASAGADQPPESEARPDDLAYVIYTSGSTGRPKGVMVEHRSLVNYALFAATAYEVDRGSGAPLHSPLGFDLTVTALFAPLVCGRTVTLVAEEEVPVVQLPQALSAGGFSFAKLTPAHLDILAGVLDPQAATAARRLIVGGEQLLGETLAFWTQHAPDVRIVNEYGPTEAVVGCSVFEIPAGSVRPGPVPIGHPIANARLLVLDENLQPVPIGVRGELCIGGASLARGYFARPALTAERFVPDAFATAPGSRLYRTGDVVRMDDDGTLEFLGRADRQVKVRGVRVELGEVEATLAQHNEVRDAAVLLREDGPSETRLVAYVVPVGPSEPAEPELLDFLGERLPRALVPERVVTMEAFPLTPNGKVDVRALPPPESRGTSSDPVPGSATPLEGELADLFEEVLHVEQAGSDDDFFELGGNSLLFAQLLARTIKQFGARLPVEKWAETPTPAGFAKLIESSRGPADEAELAPAALDVEREAELDADLLATLKGGEREEP